MANVNKVFLIGRLGQDPERRETKDGKTVVNLSVATSERRGTGEDATEHTEWHRIIAWERLGENCARYLSKGRQVYVEGRLQTRTWEDKDKIKRYTTEIVARDVQFLGPKNNNEQPAQASQEEMDEIPF